MTIRDDYGWQKTQPVMRPAWVGADGTHHSRELRSVPLGAVQFFWRDTPDGSWFLPGDDPKWEEVDLFAPPEQTSLMSPIAQRQQVIEQFGRAQALWEATVRQTDWGSDPLWWLPLPQLDPSACWFDKVTKTIRFPHRELLTKYGSVSIAEYATLHGLPPPVLEL